MKVHLNKTVGNVIIIACALNLFLFFATLFGESKPDVFSGIIGVIGIGIGILYLRGDYFEVTETTLILKALIGSAHQDFPFTSVNDFSIEGKKVNLISGDKKDKVPIYAWMADKKDWAEFIKWVESGKTPQ
jgi:hypothetical protein